MLGGLRVQLCSGARLGLNSAHGQLPDLLQGPGISLQTRSLPPTPQLCHSLLP